MNCGIWLIDVAGGLFLMAFGALGFGVSRGWRETLMAVWLFVFGAWTFYQGITPP